MKQLMVTSSNHQASHAVHGHEVTVPSVLLHLLAYLSLEADQSAEGQITPFNQSDMGLLHERNAAWCCCRSSNLLLYPAWLAQQHNAVFAATA